ncbi:MAG: MarR family transcriptional regulator [Thermoplasmatota archaeon]
MPDERRERSSRTRSIILGRISSRPGISRQELMKGIRLKEGALRYHIKILEKQKRIHSIIHRGRRCYYPGGSSIRGSGGSEEDVIGHLSPIQRRILEAVEEMNDLSQRDLARALRMNRFVISYNIGKLKDLGLVRIRRDGRSVRYRRSYPDDIRKEILRVLASDLLRGEIDEATYRRLRDRLVDEE